MSKKKKAILIISGLLALTIGITVFSVLAVHDLGLFELDRNAIDDVVDGDDWKTLFDGGGSAGDFTGIIADIGGNGGTQFQGGGSKDNNDIDEWLWKPGEPLDKDDITNAYAAAYVNDTDTGENNIGDLIIYFGLDRFANNGSAQVGFWFLQNPISLTDIRRSGGYEFSGVHDIGDVLVQSNFSQGGIIDSISVYQWLGSGGSHGTLDLVFTAADCVGASPADDPACATVNRGDQTAPWAYTPKFGTANTFPQGSFFEGGINISRLIPDAGCFSGFLAETRTSTPFNARLKDFAMGDFDLCSIGVEKTGDELSKVGDDVTYTVTIENTGVVTLYKQSIIDSLVGDLTDGTNAAIVSSDCGDSLLPSGSCSIEYSYNVLETATDPLENTVLVTYNSNDALTGDQVNGNSSWSVNLFQPTVDVQKTGDTLSKVGDEVTYTFTITNTSSWDTPNLMLDSTDGVVDDLLGNLTANAVTALCDELAPQSEDGLVAGDSCTFDVDYTVQEGDDDPLDNRVDVLYHPEGFPNPITDFDTHSVNLFQPSVDVQKTGDTLSKVDDEVTYTFTITNTSSWDTPKLMLDLTNGVVDDVLGNLTADAVADDCGELLPETSEGAGDEESCTFTKGYTVQEGDDDPLVNRVDVLYQPEGFTNPITDFDTHSVNLFQPDISVTKECTNLSKIGDPVDCTVTITNDSSDDSPDLVFDSISDTVQGDLTAAANYTSSTCGASFAWDESCTIIYSYNVPGDATDPYPNTVTVETYPSGFTNDIDAQASDSVNLFQPDVEIVKTGPGKSKATDEVTYTVKVFNRSSDDSPNLILDSFADSLVSGVTPPAACDELTPDDGDDAGGTDQCSFTYKYTVQSGDPDPLLNTATVHYHPNGYPNDITDNDGHSVNLFQPAVEIIKTGPEKSKVTDEVTYTVKIFNRSSDDSPNLILDSFSDSLVPGVTPPAACDELTPDDGDDAGGTDQCSFTYKYTVQSGDPDTLVNTATVHYHPDGYENDITDNDDHTVNLFQPDYTLTCETPSEFYTVGDIIPFTYYFTSTGSPDTPPFVLKSHNFTVGGVTQSITPPDPWTGSSTITYNHTVVNTDPSPLIAALATTYGFSGFPNELPRDASCSVVVKYGCMLSPGFWGGGEGRQKWDQTADPIATRAGFTTVTPFPWVDPVEFPGGLTYLEVLGLPTRGDVTIQLSFKYIAARLNVALADELSLPVQAGLEDLLDDINLYFAVYPVGSKPTGAAKEAGKALLNSLNTVFSDVGEEFCPNTGTIPEAP